MKKIKKLYFMLAVIVMAMSITMTAYADSIDDAGGTGEGNISGTNVYTFSYVYDGTLDAIVLKVDTTKPVKAFGNKCTYTFSGPNDNVTLNTKNPQLGSSLESAIQTMNVYGGYNLSVDDAKAALGGLGFFDKGNGVWKFDGGYLTYVSAAKIRPQNHTVAYDANGGTGAPANQTKYQGTALTLSSTKPTKTGYTFVNWTASIGGNYNAGASYTHDQSGGTVTMTANWTDSTAPSCSIFSAKPTSWSSGNGTVSIKVQDKGSGLSSIKLQRYSYVTEKWSDVDSWSYSGTTDEVSKSYTETAEGVFYYKLTVKDVAGNTTEKTSDTIYLDHSNPVIAGASNTVTSWTNTAPKISVSATDNLSGTSYGGSGVKSIVIKNASGTVVASGTTSTSYTLKSSDEGERTWTIEATDNVGHTSSTTVKTKYDITAPDCVTLTAGPTSWSKGNGTVSFSMKDGGVGTTSAVLERYSYVTKTWNTIKTYTYTATTNALSESYTETIEGVFLYRLTLKDKLGNSRVKTSDIIYLDHSNPVIAGVGNTNTAWTNVAPVISVSASDNLSGTSYGGSGVKSIVIKNASGTVVASGTTSTSYTLKASDEGVRTWTIIATDNVGHTSSATVTTKYDITAPECISFTAVPNSWSSGNGTVTFSIQDKGVGTTSAVLERYSYVTKTWSTIKTYTYSATTNLLSETYTETAEGVFLYRLTMKDKLGNSRVQSTSIIYLDHSSPVIAGSGNTNTAWTNVAPVINVTATDYLSGTTYTGSGLKTLIIYDDAGNVVASGTSSAIYTLEPKYEGIHTWKIIATDNVGRSAYTEISTKYDITKPYIEGTEIEYVTPDGITVSGYCQDNIVNQHMDDWSRRSLYSPNVTSGIKSVILYKVTISGRAVIYGDTTKKTFATSDTNSFFDMYYEMPVNEKNVKHYLIIVEDFAGNVTQKKLTSQQSMLTWFHTSIDRGSYR